VGQNTPTPGGVKGEGKGGREEQIAGNRLTQIDWKEVQEGEAPIQICKLGGIQKENMKGDKGNGCNNLVFLKERNGENVPRFRKGLLLWL